uniref:Uncharacterized protein n=1 Tax=Peronospora matthiolae TaxID=2874970 RepID=A0AAV1VMH8_9STRA
MKSTITEQSIVQALHDILPSMHADTATLKMVIEKLAVHFDVEFLDLKAQWRPQIKALLPDLIGLCASWCEDKSDGDQLDDVEDEEVLDLRPRRTRAVTKRHLVEDEDDGGDDSEASDCSAGERVQDQGSDNDRGEDNGASVERRKGRASDGSSKRKQECQGVAPAEKKSKTIAQPDFAGLAALKELGRAAGVLNPRMYRMLKDAASSTEAEGVLRDRLHDAGVTFAGPYPSSRDISAAKKKHEKEKELEGIDTSLIIAEGRPRRGAAQRISYKEERISGDEEVEEEEDDRGDDNVKEHAHDDDSAACDSDSSEATF